MRRRAMSFIPSAQPSNRNTDELITIPRVAVDIAVDSGICSGVGKLVGIGVGSMGAAVGRGAGAGVVGSFVGASDGFRVSTSLVIDATVRPGMPSAMLAAASNALEVRDDSTSLEYASDDANDV